MMLKMYICSSSQYRALIKWHYSKRSCQSSSGRTVTDSHIYSKSELSIFPRKLVKDKMTISLISYYFRQLLLKLPNVLKDLLLTSTNFRSATTVVFSLVCLLKLYLQCNLLSYYFNLFTDFSFSKGCIGDISYYVQHFTISVFVCGECWVTFCLRFY